MAFTSAAGQYCSKSMAVAKSQEHSGSLDSKGTVFGVCVVRGRAGSPLLHEANIGQGIAAEVQPVNLMVWHQGEPGQWVPVADVAINQRPAKSFPSKTLLNNRILMHIF